MIELLLLAISLILLADISTALSLIFIGRRDPQSVLAWILVVLAFPVGGFVLFLLFGWPYFSTRQFQLKSTRDQSIVDRVTEGKEPGVPDESELAFANLASFPGMARMLRVDGGAFLTAGNQVDYYTDGTAKFAALFEALEQASRHIHLEVLHPRERFPHRSAPGDPGAQGPGGGGGPAPLR